LRLISGSSLISYLLDFEEKDSGESRVEVMLCYLLRQGLPFRNYYSSEVF